MAGMFSYDLKRGDIAEAANSDARLRQAERGISNNSVDAYRDANIIPLPLWQKNMTTGSVRYDRRAIEALVIGRIIDRRSGRTRREAGYVIATALQHYADPDAALKKLYTLYDADFAKYLRALEADGMPIPEPLAGYL